MKVVNQIPYHRPFPMLLEEIKYDILSILDSGQYTNGTFCREIENKIAEIYKVKYAICCNSCTQGLLISLLSLPEKPKKIHTPAFAWYSSKWIVESIGIIPIYHDVGEYTWLMENFNSKNQTLLPVHTFGNVTQYEGKFVIYDGAHALGTNIFDIGDVTVFSLAPTKLVTSCEGGIIITDNHNMAHKMIELRDKIGRMSEIHALIGLKTLEKIKIILNWKKTVYNYYKKFIFGQFQYKCIDSNWNTIGFLNLENLKIPETIETRQYYEPLIRGLPNTDYIYKNMVCLPSYYNVNYKQVVNEILKYNES